MALYTALKCLFSEIFIVFYIAQFNRSAVKRVLNIIKTTILKNRDDALRKESVEAVTERLQQLATHTIDLQMSNTLASPGRVSSSNALTLDYVYATLPPETVILHVYVVTYVYM